MTSLRLLADDITGALDTAAEFIPLTGPVRVFWKDAIPPQLPLNAALDSGTRELPPDQASFVVREMTQNLVAQGFSYKKIDSLLRGATLHELVACLQAGPWQSCILAPAFPFQGRITITGVQMARDAAGNWQSAGDIVAALRELGANARLGRIGEPISPGFNIFDAETDADMQAIAQFAAILGPRVLLAGTGGLAQAMAKAGCPQPRPVLAGTMLGLFGSDQLAITNQLAACGDAHLHLPLAAADNATRISRQLDTDGVALVSLDLPSGLSRHDAAKRIAAEFARLTAALPRPGTLVVAGGETLHALCQSLRATSLIVIGSLQPGVPVSLMHGGRWDGVTVVSKSGAFGGPNLLRDILHLQERTN